MKALSIRPEWANFFIWGLKTIECRTWKTDYRGDILLCSSAPSQKIEGTLRGKAFLIAHLADIVPFTEEHLDWAGMDEMPNKPSYAWVFDDFQGIYPFDVKGQLHLFDVNDDLIKQNRLTPKKYGSNENYLKNIIAPAAYKPEAFIEKADVLLQYLSSHS